MTSKSADDQDESGTVVSNEHKGENGRGRHGKRQEIKIGIRGAIDLRWKRDLDRTEPVWLVIMRFY